MWCELITDFSRLAELSTDWKRFVLADRSASVFQSWEWICAFWKAYGNSVSLCSVAVHDQGRTIGLLPLVKRGNDLEFLGAPESDYNDLLCEQGSAVPVLESALTYLQGSSLMWDGVTFEKVPAHSKLVQSVPLLSPVLRRHLQVVFRCSAPAIVIDQQRPGDLDALIGKEQLSRYHKKLQRLGALTFRHFTSRREAQEHLQRFFHQHITRWAMAQERSQFLDPEARVFYEALVQEFDPAGPLRFGVLEVNSTPIAYHFGFEYNGTLTWYKPAFDVNYWDYCPGQVLLRSLLQHVKTAALNELDFTLGDEPFKYRFANQVRRNYIVYMERRPDRLRGHVRTVVRRAQHVVRQRPELKATLKRGMRRAGEFMRRFSRPDTIARTCAGAFVNMFRSLWSFDEILFWSAIGLQHDTAGDVSITPANLDDIVSLSVEFGYCLKAEELHRYRRMLKQGDEFFIARTGEAAPFLIGLGRRTEIEVERAGVRLRCQLAEPLLMIGECWRLPDPADRYVPSEVLRSLRVHLIGRQIWIYHVGGRGPLMEAIEGAGMGFRHRLICHTFLSRFERSRVESSFDQNGRVEERIVKGVIRANP